MSCLIYRHWYCQKKKFCFLIPSGTCQVPEESHSLKNIEKVSFFYCIFFQFLAKQKSLIAIPVRINFANAIANLQCACKNTCHAPTPRPCASPSKGCGKTYLWAWAQAMVCTILTSTINTIITKVKTDSFSIKTSMANPITSNPHLWSRFLNQSILSKD